MTLADWGPDEQGGSCRSHFLRGGIGGRGSSEGGASQEAAAEPTESWVMAGEVLETRGQAKGGGAEGVQMGVVDPQGPESIQKGEGDEFGGVERRGQAGGPGGEVRAQVVAIDAVEGGVQVAGVDQEWGPALVAVCLGDDDARPEAGPVRPLDHSEFVIFGVDLEEVDGAIEHVALAEGLQGGDRDHAGLNADAFGGELGGVVGVEGRPFRAIGGLVEREGAVVVGQAEVEVHVVRSVGDEPRVGGGERLDVDPGPAAIREVACHRVVHGVARADVDVVARRLGREEAVQTHVFGVLGVGNDHAIAFLAR